MGNGMRRNVLLVVVAAWSILARGRPGGNHGADLQDYFPAD